MANLKEIRIRIKSVTSTQQITKAMKMVAASRLRRAQDSILQMRPYAKKLYFILENITTWLDADTQSIYSVDKDPKKVLLVVVTSDRGLCGAFNSNAIKLALEQIKEQYTEQKNDNRLWIMPIGLKSEEYFKKRKYQVVEDYAGLFSDLSFEQAKIAAEYIMEAFKTDRYDRIELVYNEFKNVATQILRAEQFLPIPKKDEDDNDDQQPVDYIFEPSLKYILEDLIPQTLKIQFYKALLESNASEHGARMTAMEKATENAGDLLQDLKLKYNQSRQSAITNEILEIVSGAEALKGG